MVKPKPPTRVLARIFDRTTSPVYVVGPDFQITYANDACAEWTGVSLENLLSTTVSYTSQISSSDRATSHPIEPSKTRVQGLCPNPSFLAPNAEANPSFDSTTYSQWVHCFNETRATTWKRCTMRPMFDADQKHLGVLVVCDQVNHAEPDFEQESNSPSSNRATRLHSALAAIRSSTDRIHSLESLVGTSPFAHRIRRQVQSVLHGETDLLIVGPRGTGKEHLARTIHLTRDPQHQTEMIPVHCSIADQQVIQQNIKDIITSRTQSQRQSTDATQHDWLLLLDVDQLDLAGQAELLGFLRLPGFPLRTIATSSSCLIQFSARGEFSRELAHHLSTLTIELPPLSNRLEDIPLITQALVERDNDRRDRQLSGVSEDVLQQFIEFSWPHNIDQLNRTIQLAARTCKTRQIELADLPDEFQHALNAMRIGSFVETEINLDDYLAQIEKELIARALTQAKGNKTKAAKLLNVSRPKLLRRIQFFELDALDPETDSDQLDSSAFEEFK
ncbi:MAG: DNA-binding NtrC family response regulator [Mariniblastus sp.]|jgi:DNA-binding NtrC family response regulator